EAKAKTALDNTQQHETTASTHATNAKTALDAVSDHEAKAKTALDNTQQHETTASTHATNAKTALDAVSDHEAKAKTVLDNTQQHETTASTHATNAKTVLDAVSDHEAKAKTALDNTQQYEADFKTAIESTKNSAQLTHSSAHQARALVGQLESEISHIGKMAKQAPDSVIHIGHDLGGNAISVAGKQGDRVLTGVTDGIRDHDAANISQLNRVNRMTTVAHALAYKNASKINNLQYELSKTNKKIDRGLATSAALTGLFQPYNVGKVNVTVGVGGYNASTAIAIGTGYRFNEYTAVKAGVAYSGENNLMYNTSFNLEW
ncbi:YadA-like family protein, partial [Candidatus Fukatsuia symbiotica]|uniref:YadA-like family protein n=1 Tax=Candidatus Fukatsuia symbiotica TaxID=1878942 RepID=UPI001574F9C0